MKYFRAALLVFASAVAIARAQDEERQRPPTEIPDFSNLDEYIYEPRSTVRLSFRQLGGAKTTFSGQGSVPTPSTESIGNTTDLVTRTYHDGSVGADQRTTPRLDTSGNPVIDPQAGVQVADPIAPDGKTNTWSMTDASQTGPNVPNGYVAFHSYSADITDTSRHSGGSRSTAGMDLEVEHDMGKLFGSRFSWNLIGGVSVNDIAGHVTDKVAANLNTITDLYSLYGQVAPTAPYSAPSSTTQNILDANGNPVTNSDGSSQTASVDTTVLLGSTPAGRTSSSTASTTAVTNSYKVSGAYFTFRGGAQLLFPITTHFRFTVSLAAALVYAGSNYTVMQSYTPDVGVDINQVDTDSVYKIRPGYYADASLEYDVTEKTGFFAGAVFQSASSYTQELNTTTARYATKVDLSNQSGMRAGMSIRF